MRDIRNVGMIGLGKMGLPMAKHLVARGFSVAGCDPAVRGAGIEMLSSPREVANVSDLVIVVVGFDHEVEHVVFGKSGIAEAGRQGLIVALGSTVAPAFSRNLSARIEKQGMVLLDIPLARGEAAAVAGKLLIYGAGDEQAFAACRPAFSAFASDIFHLGPAGAGQVGKMVNNLILWACISANYEASRLAKALNVDFEQLRVALLDSSAGNWALQMRIEEQPMPWAEKDMRIVLSEADRLRLSVPLCGVITEVVKSVKFERGWPTPGV